MKIKRPATFFVLFLVATSIMYAQEVNNASLSEQNTDEYIYRNPANEEWKIDGLRDGWYITLSSGIQTIFADDDSKQSFGKRITYAPAFTIGKYFSPSWGLRLRIIGGSIHGFNDGKDGFYKKWTTDTYMDGKGYAGRAGYPEKLGIHFQSWDPQWERLGYSLDNGQIFLNDRGYYEWVGAKEGRLYMQHVRYMSATVNFMFDVLTTFGNKNPKKPFEITPFAGLTYAHVFKHHGNVTNDMGGINGGIDFKFRVNDNFNLNLEVNATLVHESFDGHTGNRENEGLGQVLGGVTYKIGKGAKRVIYEMDNGEIDRLNREINTLKYQLQNVPACPECPGCPPCPDHKCEFVPDPVFFKIDKSIIENQEMLKIEKVANYMNDNPNAKVIIVGYADVQTAYPSYNLALSERRVRAVANALTTKFNIPSSRISLDWEGDVEQPFTINELNRVVTFVIQE